MKKNKTFGILDGTRQGCDLRARNESYSYEDVLDELMAAYNFQRLGEGSFGVILANDACVVKVIKDIARCAELNKERHIYQLIEHNRHVLGQLSGRIPMFHLYAQLSSFCHFNMERLYSPLSGFGDIESDNDEFGHGYVVEAQAERLVMFDETSAHRVFHRDEVYLIGRPGALVHFYVNYYDPDLKAVLDNGQGILMGSAALEKSFGHRAVRQFTLEIGQLMSFLVFTCHVVPTDVEIVLASKSKDDRLVVPFVIDFNECTTFGDYEAEKTPFFIARSMHYKNGKNYFPNDRSVYYDAFRQGFLEGNVLFAQAVLDIYNTL